MGTKPLGWRPLSDEHRASLVEMGFTDEQIADRESANVYSPDPTAIQGLHLSVAITEVLTRHLGEKFATDVRAALERRTAILETSEDADEAIEAPMVGDLVKAINWTAIIRRASE
jgi:hypothetical protein